MDILDKIKETAAKLSPSKLVQDAYMRKEKMKLNQIKVEEQKREQEAERERKAQREAMIKDAYKKIFNGDVGQIVLDDLKAKCCYDESPFNESEKIMYMNLGRQDVILKIKEQLKD